MVVGAIMAQGREREEAARKEALASGKSAAEADRLAEEAGEESFRQCMGALKANISVIRWIAGIFK